MEATSAAEIYEIALQAVRDHLHVEVAVNRDTNDEIQVTVSLYLGGELISESSHYG